MTPDCPLFGLASDGVDQADRVTPAAGALLPHRFTLTTHPDESEPFGGLLSVALALASRPVDVIDHPALRSPDFPPAAIPGFGCPKPYPRQRFPTPLNRFKTEGDCSGIRQEFRRPKLTTEIICRLGYGIWIASTPATDIGTA